MDLKKKVILLLIIAAGIIDYFPSLTGDYFADDYEYLFFRAPFDLGKIFFSSDHIYAYRPVERLIITLLQFASPVSTWPVHLTCLLLHITISFGILLWMRSAGFSYLSSIAAFATFLLAQVNVLAVSSLDTLSQITTTGFCFLSIVAFISFQKREVLFFRDLFYYIAVISFAVALLCKETALCCVPMILLISVFQGAEDVSANRKKALVHLFSWLPILVVALLYMYARKKLNLPSAEFGSERLQIHFGFNVIKNFLMLLLSGIQPQSSVDIYLNLANRKMMSLIVPVIFDVVVSVMVLWGLLKCKNKPVLFIILLLLPVSLFPVILLNGISELYAYNVMPLISILIGAGFGCLIESKLKMYRRVLVCIVLIAFVVWNMISTYSKSTMMYRNGTAATKIINQIGVYYNQIPKNGKLFLINPDFSSKTEYSIFKRTGFRVLENGFNELNRRAGRNDFDVFVLPQSDICKEHCSNSLFLGLRDTVVYRLDSAEITRRIQTN